MGVANGGGTPGRRQGLSTPRLTLLAALFGALVTGLIIGVDSLGFAYHSLTLHLVLDTADACIALLLAYLTWGRYVRRRHVQDLLLAQGLFLLAVAGLGMTLLIEYFGGTRPLTVDVWLPLTLRVLGTVAIMVSALSGRRPVRRSGLSLLMVWPWIAILAAVLVFSFAADLLPAALDGNPPSSTRHPAINGHPLLLAGQVASGLCFLVASVSFTQQATSRDDELLRWLGPACILGAFSRVNYLLYPSIYSDWLYTGDLLRTGCYLVLLVGAAREIGRYWGAQTRAAVLEDRRRLARDLHDGVVQELGYIRVEAYDVQPKSAADNIVEACDRGLDEARAAIDALGRGTEEPLGFVLHRAARQVAERYGGQVVVDLDDSVEADASQRHALLRIMREAVSNALRHGDPQCVRVQLTRDHHHRRLVVKDDGRGFEVGMVSRSSGFGLTSMRERAAALPGQLELESAPGDGTVVAVTW